MLRDPKARGLAETFALQWLGLRPLGDTVRPDPKRFPEFDDDLADAMRREVLLLVEHVVREDRSLLELIDADYTFVNDRLAKHYGLPGVTGPEMRRVALPDRNRGGVLGMAAVLTVTSYPLRTSPVLRGKWVLEELLGSKVPPPPPDVPELPKDDAHREGADVPQAAGGAPQEPRLCDLPRPDGPARLRAGELRRARPLADRSRRRSRSTPPASCRPARSSAARRS